MNIVFLVIGAVILILGIYVYISFGKRARKEIEELKNEFNLIFKSPLVGEGKDDMRNEPDVRKVIIDPKGEFGYVPNYYYKNCGDEFRNKEHVLKNLTTWHKNIYSISDALKDDKDVVLAFIENCVVFPYSGDVFDCNANYFNEYDLYHFLAEISEDLRRDKDVLNALRRFLLNDDYANTQLYDDVLVMKARDTLLANDREEALKTKLSNLDNGEDKARKKI